MPLIRELPVDTSHRITVAKEASLEKRAINPTDWLTGFNINHAIEVKGAERVLFVSGQTSNDAEGAPMHPGDLVAQFRLAWENLKAALVAAEMEPK